MTQSTAQTSARPSRTAAMLSGWAPVSMVRAKNLPPPANGATAALSVLYPDWESRELNAHAVPRSASDVAGTARCAYHDGARVSVTVAARPQRSAGLRRSGACRETPSRRDTRTTAREAGRPAARRRGSRAAARAGRARRRSRLLRSSSAMAAQSASVHSPRPRAGRTSAGWHAGPRLPPQLPGARTPRMCRPHRFMRRLRTGIEFGQANVSCDRIRHARRADSVRNPIAREREKPDDATDADITAGE